MTNNPYFLSIGSHSNPEDGRCAMETPCEEWAGSRSDKGYGIAPGGRRAHRVAWEQAHGQIPEGMVICHRCDNPPCVNVDHLFLGTQLDNIADRHAKGRTVNPPSRRKLTIEQAENMRLEYALGGTTQQHLAKRYGMSRGNVSKIVNGVTYVD